MAQNFDPDVMRFHQKRKVTWLRHIAKDPRFHRKALTLRLAVYIFDRFHTGLGYIEFSMNHAAAWLDVDPSQIARCRKELVKLGWLRLVAPAKLTRQSYSANRYDLAGGPEDYLLDVTAPENTTDH